MITTHSYTKRLLCIGGKSNGRMCAVEGDLPTYRIAEIPPFRVGPISLLSRNQHVDIYRVERIQGQQQCFEVLCETSMSVDEMIRELITQYRPSRIL